MPKSVVLKLVPLNFLDWRQDMHKLKEVVVAKKATSQDSSERHVRKNFTNDPPSGSEDVISINKQQQVETKNHLFANGKGS